MSNTQLSRAIDSAYDCLKELREICSEVVDSKDARIVAAEHALDKMAEILYVEKDE